MQKGLAKIFTGVYLLLIACAASAESAAESATVIARLDGLIAEVAQDYPDVRHVSVAELKQTYESVLVVDVREREEFDLSHLPGAVHAATPEAIDAVRAKHPEKTLVLYCTVGVRSAIAARELQQRTPKNHTAGVVNLAGSIFAWANAGEPLVDATGPTDAVHPYSVWWGMRYLAP